MNLGNFEQLFVDLGSMISFLEDRGKIFGLGLQVGDAALRKYALRAHREDQRR